MIFYKIIKKIKKIDDGFLLFFYFESESVFLL